MDTTQFLIVAICMAFVCVGSIVGIVGVIFSILLNRVIEGDLAPRKYIQGLQESNWEVIGNVIERENDKQTKELLDGLTAVITALIKNAKNGNL